MAQEGKGAVRHVLNWPTVVPLLSHYYPFVFGYEALAERLAALDVRLARLEEYLYFLVMAVGDDETRALANRLHDRAVGIAEIKSWEELVMSYDQGVLAQYVAGINDIRMLMPHFGKVDKSKMPRLVVAIWDQPRGGILSQARSLGIPLPDGSGICTGGIS